MGNKWLVTPRTIASVVLLAGLIALVFFLVGKVEREQTLETMKSRMDISIGIRKNALMGHIDRLRHDALFLSRVPPIQGLIRANANHGIDAQEKTDAALWAKRLEQIFTEFNRANPALTKIRFIGVADNGKELIRVERKLGDSIVVASNQLQQKGDRQFLREAFRTPKDQVYISDLDLNHDFGHLEIPFVRTIRAAAPVYAADGTLFGALVINLDLSADFAELTGNSSTFFKLYLTNSTGDYLLNPDQSKTFGFEQGQVWRWQDDFRPVTNSKLPVGIEEFSSTEGAMYVRRADLPLDQNDPKRFLTLRIVVAEKTVEQAATLAQRNAFFILLGVGLVLGAILVSYWWQKRHLDKKQAELAAIVENSHDAIIGKTLDGIVSTWNTGAEAMFGYSAKEAIGKSLMELIVPQGCENEEKEILEQMRSGKKIIDLRTTRRKKDGNLLSVSVTVSPILSSLGRVIGIAKTVRDISQQIIDEKNIRDLNRTLEIQVAERTAQIHDYASLQHAILDNAGYAMIATDPTGLITIFNPSAERMFGYTAEELVGKKNPGIFHEPNEVIERAKIFSAELNTDLKPGFESFVAKTIRGLPNEHEWTFLRKDGSQFPALLSITSLKNDHNDITGYLGIAIDLTERHIAEKALQAKNRFLDTLADNIPGLVAYWDRDLLCRFSNRTYFEWYGVTGQEMQGIHLRKVLGENIFQINEPYLRAAFEGSPQRFERANLKADGTLRHTFTHYIPDLDNGVVRGLIMLVSDVSGLKQAQLDLETLNQKLEVRSADLERTGQIAGVGAWSVDLIENKIHWSRQTARIHDVPIDYEPTYDDALRFYTKDAQTVLRSVVNDAMKSHQPWDLELPLITATGRQIWTRSVGEVELNDDGVPIRLVGALQDITERRLDSDALTSTRDQLLMAAKVAGLGIWRWTIEDNSLQWSDLMFELFDQPVALRDNGLRYEHWKERVHPDDVESTVARLNNAIAGHDTFDPVFRIVRRDGDIRYMKAGAFIEKDKQGKTISVTGINMDVTDQLLLESSLRQAKDLSDSANRAKSEFLANMSHEIRTPMNAILGMLQLLQQTGLDHRQIDYVSKTESAARSLLGILNDILDFSRVEAGKMELDVHPFSVEKLLRDVAIILSANTGDKDLEVLFDIDPAVPEWIIADDLRLQQVLINLTGNAIKFTERGEIILTVKLASQLESDITLEFSVRDTGIGISAEHCARIFEGFSQAEASTARRYGGSGLGLAISQRLVQLMGGTLQVNSSVNVGSTFQFSVHCVKTEPLKKIQKIGAAVSLPAQRCLVIEDNATARQILAEMISSFGWLVDAIDSGKAALEMISRALPQNPYDAIFVDWLMPDMDGWETCEKIRQLLPENSTALVVMVTAHSREIMARHPGNVSALMDALLVKPVTAKMLYEAVAECRAAKTQTEPRKIAAPVSQQRLSGLKILVVEDNIINQIVAKELLGNEAATVVVVDGGRAGIDIIQSARPPFDIVLMDVQMPDMDGYMATEIIRKELGLVDLPVIAITANVMPSDRAAALAAGMNDHIGKPFELDQLIAVILKHTGTHPSSGLPIKRVSAIETEHSLPEFDSDTAMIRLGNIPRIYTYALKGFLREASDYQFEYTDAFQNNQLEEARRVLHTLKGLAGTIGAFQLAGLAAGEEKALKRPAAQLREIPTVWVAVDIALTNAQRFLEEFDEDRPLQSEAQQLDLAALQAGLHRLQALLGSSDMAADQEFNAVQQACAQAFPDETKKIGQCIERLDYSTAAQLCADLLQRLNKTPPNS